jgi:hypothetical protein
MASFRVYFNESDATVSNHDRVAINDGIFSQHLKATHYMDPLVDSPTHTICIKACNLKSTENSKKTSLNKISKIFCTRVAVRHMCLMVL